MFMSTDNVHKNSDTDLPIFDVVDQQQQQQQQQNTTPQSNNSVASSASSVDRSNSPDGGSLLCNGIIEVSDKDDDELEEPVSTRRTQMPSSLRKPHSHIFLMTCGHPAPPADPARIKHWQPRRSWCPTCNPLTTRNLIRSNELSGWRKTINQLIDQCIFPLSVLNLNETFIYTGNNGHETSIMSTNANGPPFMMDLDLFLGIVCANDLCRLPLRALTCLRAFIHSDTRVIPFFEKIHSQSLCHFSVNLLETAIRLTEESSEHSEIAFRRSKMALQCFYQTSVRVPFFRETIYKHQLTQWFNLLRIEFLRHDIILCTLTVIREMHAWFFHVDDLYIRFLSDLLVLYTSPNNEYRAFITNIFIILFNIDSSFLYDAYRLFDREIFTDLLSVLESALNFAPICRLRDYEIPPKACLHPANLSFCLELLEQIDRELSESRTPRYDISVRLTMLVHIVHLCASCEIYNETLHKGNAISMICGILKALMFVQREVGVLLVRAHHLHMLNNRQRAGVDASVTPTKRYEAQQQRVVGLRSRPTARNVAENKFLVRKGVEIKRHARVEEEEDDEASTEEQSPDSKPPPNKDRRTMHALRAPITADRKPPQAPKNKILRQHSPERRTTSTPEKKKKEMKMLSREVELPIDVQIVPQASPINENGDEPRKKHARMTKSEDGNELDSNVEENNELDSNVEEKMEPIDDSAEMEEDEEEEAKPLLSPSESCSSSTSGEEAPTLTATKKQHPPRPPIAKVRPMIASNPALKVAAPKIGNSNSYEEALGEEEETENDEDDDEEEDSGLEEESNQQTLAESIFGTRAETLFTEYMAERSPDFDINALNEDELLIGLPHFRSIQPIYQMIITRNIPPHLFVTLKQSTLRAITYLCKDSQRNKMIAGRLEAIPLILQCAMKPEGERAVMLALLALKALCWQCVENQERLLDITEGCSHFIDRQQLFSKMGFKMETDKSGKTSLVPADKE